MNDHPDEQEEPRAGGVADENKHIYLCDRCGFEMIESHCKIVCPNCGSRYDCSDLNIYFD